MSSLSIYGLTKINFELFLVVRLARLKDGSVYIYRLLKAIDVDDFGAS